VFAARKSLTGIIREGRQAESLSKKEVWEKSVKFFVGFFGFEEYWGFVFAFG
jgi:hypothetical protein